MSHPLRTITVMGMRGRWVPYGIEAAEALHHEIRAAKGAEPLSPVTVVVPSNQVGVSARRRLARATTRSVNGAGPAPSGGTGLIGVSFLTPYRLAELLAAPALAGTGRRPVSTPVITAAVRAALAEEPGLFAAVAEHPATEAALVATYRELRDLSAGALDALAGQGPRAAHVVRLHRATRERLEPSWSDEEDLMAAAVEVLSQRGAAHLGTVVVHLPQRLSHHAAALLRAVADDTPVVVLAGSTGDTRADAEVANSMSRLRLPCERASVGGMAAVVSAETTTIVTASDADEEVRAAVRLVIDEIRGGTPLDRIAILHASADPYGRLVHEHLTAAGIAANGVAEVPVSGRLAGRALLQLLELAQLGFRRKDVFAWLTSVPLLHRGRWAPVTAWERLSRDAGVVGGPDGWDQLLGNLADRLQADADTAAADPDRPQWQSERWAADAARAHDLRSFMGDLIGRLRQAATQAQAWSGWTRWARALLDDLLGGADRRQRWPEVERKAAERVELALGRLAALDAVEGPVGLDVFTRTLAIELESDLGRVGRFGEGVLVGSVAMAVGVDLDLVVLLGLAEGTFPATVRDDSLLPDAERRAAGGELAPRAQQVDRAHHQFLAALAAAPRHVLGVPRGDLRRSTERVASRWVLDVASCLAGHQWWSPHLLDAQEPWVHHVASFDAGVRAMGFPATAQEHRLRSLVASAPSRTELQAVAAEVDAVLGGGVGALDARATDTFTRFDGNLAGLTIASPVATGTSATSLQRWAECPHAYFLQNVLHVQPVEQPEELLEMSPLEKGSLVHKILERFVEEVLSRPPEERPAPDAAWSADDAARMEAIARACWHDYEQRGLTGHAIFGRRDRARLLADLGRFLVEDSAHRRATGTRPVAVELGFGLPDDHGRRLPPVGFLLPDGRSLPLRGKVDRLDVAEDGTVHLVDYKTGSDRDYKKLSEADPHEGGSRLQLAIYGQAARQYLQHPEAPVQADYWFVSGKGNFNRPGYRVTSEVIERVGQAIQTIVSGIEQGLFIAHPKPSSTSPRVDCHFCDPDGLGTADLRRRWAAKVGDPNLASYVELTEPIAPASAEAEA